MKTLIQLKGIIENIVIVVLLFACTNKSPEYLRYKETMGKNVNLDMFQNFSYKNNILNLEQIRKQYEFISIVYLQENCKSCYEKFITWHKEMKKVANENHTVIFIVNGRFDDEFLVGVNSIEHVDINYYLVMDPNSSFLENNSGIPKWIFENSVLIDGNNKVQMIGEPFYNSELTNKFYSIVKN
jgi:hypothetical protein